MVEFEPYLLYKFKMIVYCKGRSPCRVNVVLYNFLMKIPVGNDG